MVRCSQSELGKRRGSRRACFRSKVSTGAIPEAGPGFVDLRLDFGPLSTPTERRDSIGSSDINPY